MSSEPFTFCSWAGYEGSRSIFRLRVKCRVAVSALSSSRRTRLQLGHESQRRYGGNGITETGQLHVDYFCLMFTFNVH